MKHFTIEGRVKKYPGPAGWYFVAMDRDASVRLKESYAGPKVGWGYIPVTARVGDTSWETTLFPTKSGEYLIAIKANVRKKEGIMEGDRVTVHCKLSTI